MTNSGIVKRKPTFRTRTQSSNTKLRKRPYYQSQLTKYITMARESLSQGDRIMAEYYYQHAEHYLRSLSELDYEYSSFDSRPMPSAEPEVIEELQQV